MSPDYKTARQIMVDCQIRTVDVTNPRVIEAFGEVPREAFVPEALRPLAYVDSRLEVAPGRYLSPPAPLAKLVQAAGAGEEEVVLLIGCASGYSAAILSLLSSSVVALESDSALAEHAAATLSELGYFNVAVVRGDPARGYEAEGPYDLVFIDGCVGRLPDGIVGQMKEGGRLVAVDGHGNAASARVWVREAGSLSSRQLFNCALPPLPGLEKQPEFQF
ncbi:MAG: protein-L-isoaspartate O-methyltransferase [Pseudomonadota bacterium]|nr:protein-L-isoaspartate O-methyltransferase [Pseudomonadota bacterium]